MSAEMPVLALLAGGLGTRLGALTEQRPKSMVLVAGEPFIVHQLRLFHRRGIRRVVICAGHLSGQLVDFVGDGRAFDCHVEWSFDGHEALGTGGAIAAALPLLGRTFLVSYGDAWLDTDYAAIVAAYHDQQHPALMTVYRNAGRWGLSNAAFTDGRLVRYDKSRNDPSMQHIDYGVAVLDRSVFARTARTRFDLADLYRDLVAGGRMAGIEIGQRFYEIGCPAGLSATEQLLRGPLSDDR